MKESKVHFLHFGEHPILDFCNTIVFHSNSCEDRLEKKSDLESFFLEFFELKIKVKENDFQEIIQFRSILRDFFKTFIKNSKECKLTKLNQFLSKHPFTLKIDPICKPTYKKIDILPTTKLIIEFQNFMNDCNSKRLKKCKNPNCSHFFYDKSKNNSRSWCSMKSCGNIMKARAFQARRKNL